jgi:mRNA-degrading endonuclease RelE of RelBE toxin-antitoxin system
MNYKVESLPNFSSELKGLVKKYPSLVDEIEALSNSLRHQPIQGISLGKSSYKIRIAIKSKGKGKRGGGRVITHIKVTKETVYLLSIYSKGDKDDITDEELTQWIEQIAPEN